MKLKEQLIQISPLYFPNPYNNWPHGKYVGEAMMVLEGSKGKVSPGRMAGYLHNADHRGFVQEDDEERATQIAHDKLTEWGFDSDYIDGVKTHIMGTVFTHRGNLILPEQKLIADADLSKLGGDYSGFIQNAVRFFLETENPGEITDERIQSFFKENQPGFFRYLTNISGKEESPFLTGIAQKKFPNFSRNKDQMAQDIEENPRKLIGIVRQLETKSEIQNFRKAA